MVDRDTLSLINTGHTNHKHFGQVLVPRNPNDSNEAQLRSRSSLRNPEVSIRSYQEGLLHHGALSEPL